METPASPFPERLTEGYRAFLDDRFDREKDRYEQLAETGQTPKIMLIGCCDSRVSPEVIFDARPGEMFVVPRGVEHRPVAVTECEIVMIEPVGTLNTGDAGGARTVTDPEWL